MQHDARHDQCAADIQQCWRDSDLALEQGDAEAPTPPHAFEVVDSFPACGKRTLALRFLCILTWVKVSAALETTGQEEESGEARRQIFSLVDEMLGPTAQGIGAPWTRWNSHKAWSRRNRPISSAGSICCATKPAAGTHCFGAAASDIDLKVRGTARPTSLV